MGFWMLTGLLSLLIGGALVIAAWRSRDDTDPAAAYDLQVYRDQLREIDKDLARGVLTEDEAERTRTEVARRVLEADRALQAETAGTHAGRPQRIAIVVGVVVVIAGAFGLYRLIGAPNYPDLPIETRISLVEEARAARPSQLEAEAGVPQVTREDPDPRRAELVADLRAAMETHPDEPEGLRLLAFEEARVGNYVAARTAQAHLIEVLGDEATAQHRLDLAEMMFLAAGGYVSPEAEALLNSVLQEDRMNGAARYYVGLMYAQQGRPDLGYPIWRNLLADSDPDAPWLPAIREQIELVAAMAGDDISVELLPQPPLPNQPGPTAEDIEAASEMSAEDRQSMIESMVAGLSERLANEGGTPEEWARLISAYIVLGQPERARPIYQEALSAFAQSDAALEIIREAGAPLDAGGDIPLPADAPLREPSE
ncbi:c-type cytochrome biogenesis protein CcmI [Nioella aestuarii]|uniref:c-type cytochrome biogenesis protein CcmI n=1 Tax=Nioella aestuarii TaxID=1662864 RepID=UPI003D7FCAF4